jgi:sec-independent protein translocase protein TatA
MPELLIILAIVIVLFGARRLPDLGSGIAKGIKGFRKGIAEDEKGEAKGEAKAPPEDKPAD